MLSGLLAAVPRGCLPPSLRTAARVQTRCQVPNKQGMLRADAAAGQRRKEREKEWKNEQGRRATGQSKEKQIQSWGGEGGGEMEAGREAEKKKEVGGGESEPQENVRHTLEREEDELPVRNYKALKPALTKKHECFCSHLIYGRTQVWGARPCITTSTIWIYLLCLAFQEARRLQVGVQE